MNPDAEKLSGIALAKVHEIFDWVKADNLPAVGNGPAARRHKLLLRHNDIEKHLSDLRTAVELGRSEDTVQNLYFTLGVLSAMWLDIALVTNDDSDVETSEEYAEESLQVLENSGGHYVKGKIAAKFHNDYTTALAEYDRAYELDPDGKLLGLQAAKEAQHLRDAGFAANARETPPSQELREPETVREVRVAMSYLDDIKKQIARIQQIDNIFTAIERAEDLLNSDFALAFAEIEKARAKGADADLVASRAYYLKGSLAEIITDEIDAKYGHIFHEDKESGKTYSLWLNRQAEAFKASIQELPMPEAYYSLGWTYYKLGNKSEALKAFQEAENGDDEEIGIKATKAIARLGILNTPTTSATASHPATNSPTVVWDQMNNVPILSTTSDSTTNSPATTTSNQTDSSDSSSTFLASPTGCFGIFIAVILGLTILVVVSNVSAHRFSVSPFLILVILTFIVGLARLYYLFRKL